MTMMMTLLMMLHRSRVTVQSAAAVHHAANSIIISCSSRTAAACSSKQLSQAWRHRWAVTLRTRNRTRPIWSSTTCPSPCHKTTFGRCSQVSVTSSRVNSSETSPQVSHNWDFYRADRLRSCIKCHYCFKCLYVYAPVCFVYTGFSKKRRKTRYLPKFDVVHVL